MASRWLPNIEEFFESLLRLIETSETNFSSSSYDSCEFLFRRLDAYERTLSTLLLRLTETFECVDPQSQPRVCIQQLSTILDRTTRFRVHFERIYSLNNFERESNELNSSEDELNAMSYEGPGRPKFSAGREEIEALKTGGGFSWSEIARTFGISERTLRRRRHELGMNVEGREFSNLSDHDVDNIVRDIVGTTPGAGLRLVQGGFRERGIIIQRHRIIHSMHRVDPVLSTLRSARKIVRRTYNVPCPNALWWVGVVFFFF